VAQAEKQRKPTNKRTRARRASVQALYQWQLTGQSALEIEGQFVAERLAAISGGVDFEYFQWLLHEVIKQHASLDEHYASLLDRPPEQLDPIEQVILRLGVLELSARPEVPLRVVINEAIELAKLFGAEKSHRYINGVLDKAAAALRPTGL
jgi:N utilization substance protein B